MIRNLDTDTLTFGGEDEFHQRLRESRRHCFEGMRTVLWAILRCPCHFWTFLKYLTISIAQLFLRQYIAVIVLVLSATALPGSIVILRDLERLVTAVYCFSFICCSIISLSFKKGSIRFLVKSRRELLENRLLLAEYGHGADHPVGYGARDHGHSLEQAFENMKEPRPRRSSSFKRSSSYEPLNCCEEISAGPSHAPDCANRFAATSTDDSYDFDEPSNRFTVARISAIAIKAFGPPLQVFGADAYEVVLNSSDEETLLNDSVDLGAKTFELQAEVHRPDSYSPLTSVNVGSSSAESALVTKDESTTMVGSDLSSNMSKMQDPSSVPSCSYAESALVTKDERATMVSSDLNSNISKMQDPSSVPSCSYAESALVTKEERATMVSSDLNSNISKMQDPSSLSSSSSFEQ